MRRQPYEVSRSYAGQREENVSIDLLGPIDAELFRGARGIITG